MRVTSYTKQKFNELFEVEKRCFTDAWSETGMKNELSLKQAHYYVAIADDKVIGYAGFWLILDEAEIMKVAVLPEARNCGVGQSLITAIADDAEKMGAKKLLLEVREGNDIARMLYERNGFTAYGVREKYYEGKENAVLYRRNI